MSQTKAEKITSIQEQITLLENRCKQLIQEQKIQERKDRTKRLCRRMGLFESLLPESIPLTEEQFKTFLEKTILSEYSRKILSTLTTENAATTTPQNAGAAVQSNLAIVDKSVATEQEDDGDESEDGETEQG